LNNNLYKESNQLAVFPLIKGQKKEGEPKECQRKEKKMP